MIEQGLHLASLILSALFFLSVGWMFVVFFILAVGRTFDIIFRAACRWHDRRPIGKQDAA